MAKKNLYIIEVNFFSKKAQVELVGPATMALTEGICDKAVKLYLRDHKDLSVPRLNQDPGVAEQFTSKDEAQKIADELSGMTFKEGKVMCEVKEFTPQKPLAS